MPGRGAASGVGGAQDLDKAPAGGGCGGCADEEFAEFLQARVEVAEEGGEREQTAQAQVVFGDLPGPGADHRQHADGFEEFTERAVHPGQPDLPQPGPHPDAPFPVHLSALRLLTTVGLHQGHVGEALLQEGGESAVAVAFRAARGAHQGAEDASAEPDQRGGGEGDERQLPVRPEGGDREDEGARSGGDQLDGGGGDQCLHGLDVPGETGDQVAGAVAVEGVRRDALKMPEDVIAQAQEEVLSGPTGEGTARGGGCGAGHGQAQP